MRFVLAITLALTSFASQADTRVKYDVSHSPAVCNQQDYNRLPPERKKRSRFVGINTGFVDAVGFKNIDIRLVGQKLVGTFQTQLYHCIDKGQGPRWTASNPPKYEASVLAPVSTAMHIAPMSYFFASYWGEGQTRFEIPMDEILDKRAHRRFMEGQSVEFSVYLYHGVSRKHLGFQRSDLWPLATRNPFDISWVYGGHRQLRLTVTGQKIQTR